MNTVSWLWAPSHLCINHLLTPPQLTATSPPPHLVCHHHLTQPCPSFCLLNLYFLIVSILSFSPSLSLLWLFNPLCLLLFSISQLSLKRKAQRRPPTSRCLPKYQFITTMSRFVFWDHRLVMKLYFWEQHLPPLSLSGLVDTLILYPLLWGMWRNKWRQHQWHKCFGQKQECQIFFSIQSLWKKRNKIQ